MHTPVFFSIYLSLGVFVSGFGALSFLIAVLKSPVLTSDASISIDISIRSLCASEDSRDINISISFFLMLMLMFSEDIVDISISAR